MAARAAATQDDVPPMVAVGDHRNEVLLVGRIAAPAEERTLPSGDLLVTWRLVVDRPPPKASERRMASVDALDCVAWRGDVRRSALSWSVGDTIEVTGALRRRFWRGASGPVSRTEVEVIRGRRVAKGG
jgi:single-strand DNA-binding protein